MTDQFEQGEMPSSMPFVRTLFSGLTVVPVLGLIWSAWLANAARADSEFEDSNRSFANWDFVSALLVFGGLAAVVMVTLWALISSRSRLTRLAVVIGVVLTLVAIGSWDLFQQVLDHREAIRLGP